MKIESLHIYPVKSCQGISVPELVIESQGPKWDRQWMLVDQNGKFISQRTHPKLARVKTELTKEHLLLGLDGAKLQVALAQESTELMRVEVWGTAVQAHLENAEISEAFSRFLGEKAFLVRFGSASKRSVVKAGEDQHSSVRFADGFPLLLSNVASLEALNQRLAQAVGMDRFRPNIVVSGPVAFAEDQWKMLRSMKSGVLLENSKPCSRCVMVNLDQVSGVQLSKDPLAELAKFRRDGKNVNFAINLIHRSTGVLRVGEDLQLVNQPEI